MDWKLIIRTAFFGFLFCVISIISVTIFAGCYFPKLFNVNIEDYLIACALIGGLPFAICVYQKVESKKILHAFVSYGLIYFFTIISTLILGFMFYLLIVIWCKIEPCRSIPFL